MTTAYSPYYALIGFLALLCPTILQAQTTVGDVDAAGNTIIDRFDNYDLNRDGFLQPDEHSTESGLSFEAMDANKDNLSSREEYCNELSRQTDALSGKPLRRTAMDNRFDLECGDGGRNMIDTMPSSHMDPDLN